jgi:nuclear transport factor 2 (NTF2) superfamily protein
MAQLTIEDARAILHRNEELFGRADLPAILEGFHSDVIVKFADIPEIRGKAALEKFLAARFARQKGYRLRKALRAFEPQSGTIVGSWTGEWEDGRTGKAMRGRGTEILTVRDGLCVEWDATFNMWEDGAGPATSLL